MKARCENRRCDWRGDSDEMLRAKNPFDETDEITGCPKCKQIECVMGVCDEPGCWEFVTCGTSVPGGYRSTCSKHRPNAKSEGAEGGFIAEGSLSTAGLGGDEPDRPYLTHSCGCEYVGKDGTKRRMLAQRYSDTTVGVHISTYWDGEGSEPTTTSVRMGVEAYSVLLDMLNVFAVDRERFCVTDATTPNAEVTGVPALSARPVDCRVRGQKEK